MNKLTMMVLAAGLSLSAVANAKTIKMEVHGLVCSFCAQGIEKKLKSMSPTKEVFVSLEQKIVAVSLKDGQDIPDAKLTSELKDAGYDVRAIARVDDSLEKIRADVAAKK